MSELEQINQVLLEEIEKRDEEIQKLRNDINSLLDAPADSPSSSLPEKEVMKLVKKNRNLIVKLNKAKGQIVQLEMNLKQEQEKFAKSSGALQAKHYGQKTRNLKSNSVDLSETSQEEDQALEQLLSEQKKKYEKSVLRINELREKNQKMKLEMSKMKNLLQKELGDNVDIDSLLNDSENNEGWRGRQQEILLLKSKVKQLQSQVILMKKRAQEADYTDACNEMQSTSNSTAMISSVTSADIKQTQTLRQLSEARNQEILDLQQKLKEMESSQERWKKKHDAVKARCNILEREISSLNLKMTRIIKKTENDDKYIKALKTEVDKLREKLKDSNKKLSSTKTIKPGESLSSTLTILHNQEVDELQRQVADLEKELNQKEGTIQTLKAQILSSNEDGDDLEISGNSDLKVTLLELEVEKLKELQQLHQAQLKEYELNEQVIQGEILVYKSKIRDLENSLSKFKGKVNPPPVDEDDTQKLADSLQLTLDENQALKQTIKSLRVAKEKEIKIYKDLLLKQKKQLESVIEKRNESVIPTAYVASLTDESLRQENEQLTKNLKEMKNRYTAATIQLQNAQNQLKHLNK